MRTVRLLWSTAAVAAVLLLAPILAGATAFFVNQQSVKGLGRVDSGNTTAADELGTIFFNPAGLNLFWRDAETKGDQAVSFGVEVIVPRSSQHNAGSTAATPGTLGAPVKYGGPDASNPTDPTPIPNFYYARKLDERTSIGFGSNVPFGLRANFDKTWYGRYDAIEASLRTINLSAVVARQVTPRLSVGGGIDAQYARSTLTQAIPNPLAPGGPTPDTDARISTHGHAYTAGFNVGLMYALGEPESGNRVGFHYRSGFKHHIKGTAEISGFQRPLAQFNGETGARADLDLPAIATIGVRWQASNDVALFADAQWYDWSTFKEVRIRFDNGNPDGVRVANYRDAYGIAIGAEHHVKGSPFTMRGGLHYDTTPTVDQFRETTDPDSERLWLGLGATYRVSDRFQMDFAFNHVFFRDTKIAVTRTFFDGTPIASAVQVNGDVKTHVDTLAFDLRWRF